MDNNKVIKQKVKQQFGPDKNCHKCGANRFYSHRKYDWVICSECGWRIMMKGRKK